MLSDSPDAERISVSSLCAGPGFDGSLLTSPLGSTAGLSPLSRLLCAAVKGGDPQAALIVDFVTGLWFGRGRCWTKIDCVCSLKVVLLLVLASL